MKKILTLTILCLSLILCSSCDTFALSFGDPYYEYVYLGKPIIYVEGVPYYHYWHENRWIHELVPFEHRPFIQHMSHPRPFMMSPSQQNHGIMPNRYSSTRIGGNRPNSGDLGRPKMGGNRTQPRSNFGRRR